MRRLAFALMITACTQVPTAEDMPVPEQSDSAPGYSMIPSRVAVPETTPPVVEVEAPEPEPAPTRIHDGPPKIVVTRYDRSRITDSGDDGTALCPFSVEARGLPAVREDGRTIAYHVAETLSSSDGEDEIVTVQQVDVATDTVTERTVLVDGNDFDGRYHCWRLWRQAKARALEINTELASGWRPMQKLPVDADLGEDAEPEMERERESPHTRPVELRRIRKEVVLRVPGVRA